MVQQGETQSSKQQIETIEQMGAKQGKQQQQKRTATDEGAQQHNAREYVLDAVRGVHELQALSEHARDYAHSIGLVARNSETKFDSIVSVLPPVSLFPSPFPKELFEQAQSVQTTLNELYFKIANDHEFLMDAYKDVVKGDPFTERLVEIAKTVHEEGIHQPLMVGTQRADYMAHFGPDDQKMRLQQVEVNPCQIGGPGAATGTTKFHRKMLDKMETMHGGKLGVLANAVQPENKPRHGMAHTLYQAWKMFGDPNAVLVFLNQPDLFPVCHFEQLQFAQFHVQKLGRADGQLVQVVCMSLLEAVDRLRLDESDFSLYADGTRKVALIHMAYGYVPEHFPTEAVWQSRIAMERSTAIMSPNIRLQLSGTKKIQQLLALPGTLERFFPGEPERIAQLRATFTDLWGLEGDDEATRAVIREAIRDTKNYVLKNQMDSGQGKYFDEAMAEQLQTMSLDERSAFIIQRKIFPLVAKNYFLYPFEPAKEMAMTSEVGIYGSLIGDGANGKIHWNSVDGHLCRSKPAEFNEGGVCHGGGVIDSVLLFPVAELMK